MTEDALARGGVEGGGHAALFEDPRNRRGVVLRRQLGEEFGDQCAVEAARLEFPRDAETATALDVRGGSDVRGSDSTVVERSPFLILIVGMVWMSSRCAISGLTCGSMIFHLSLSL